MNRFTLFKYSFGDYLGIVGDEAHPKLAEARKRLDADGDIPALMSRCGFPKHDGKAYRIIDAGAFIGDTAYAFAKFDEGHIYVEAFEPFLDAYVAMLYNTRGLNVKAINRPVGNGEWVQFVYECPGENRGMRRMKLVPPGTPGSVQTARIDDLPFTGKVAILKIDVEGLEVPAILGARETILRDGCALYVEHYPDGLRQQGYSEKDLVDCIESLGYKMEMIGEPPRWDWLATPK